MPTIRIPIWIRSEYVTMGITSLHREVLTAYRIIAAPVSILHSAPLFVNLSHTAPAGGGFFLYEAPGA